MGRKSVALPEGVEVVGSAVRHTYATMCLMAGMNPAFIANQLGHSVQMLLSTYARWLNSTSDWTELQKLENRPNGTKLVQA